MQLSLSRIVVRFSLVAAGVFAAGVIAAATPHHRGGPATFGAVHRTHDTVRRVDPLLAVVRTPRPRRRIAVVRANFILASRKIQFAMHEKPNSATSPFDDIRPHFLNDYFAQPRGPPEGMRA